MWEIIRAVNDRGHVGKKMRIFSLLLVFVITFFGGCAGLDGNGRAGIQTPPEAGWHSASISGQQKFTMVFDELFNTVTIVIAYAESQDEFDYFAALIYDRMEELHRLYDIYHEYEGVNNLYTINQNAGLAPVQVEKEIIDMLLLSRFGYELTDGVVNIALGPVLRIWSDYRAEGSELPTPEMLEKAAQITEMDELIIDEVTGTVFLRKLGMSLDVGSVAKAYATQLAVKEAVAAGLSSVLVSAGGNIISFGKPLDGVRERWSIGIKDPDYRKSDDIIDTVFLADLTVSCSGGYERYYLVDGQSYHHIIDPVTLMPANRYKQVTVIHENAALADILSTALFIIPFEEGARLAESVNAEVLWIDMDGRWQATAGYREMSKELSGYSSVD